MAVITIIGSGMMGSALAFPASDNGHEIRLVGTHLDAEIIDTCRKTGRHPKFNRVFPAQIKYFQIDEVNEALSGADLVIGGVSSFGVEWFGEYILPIVPESVPIITVTKGLLDNPDGRLITYPEYWESSAEKLGKNISICSIGGPCTSYELVYGDMTEVTFCGKNIETLRWIKSLLQTSYYHISLSTDVVGVESAVALKNAYALGIALTIGVNQKLAGVNSEQHYNSQAALFGQGIREMYKLLSLQKAATLNNLCVGAGDLYVTVYGGRTRLIGILLGRGYTISEARNELNGVTLESLVVAERVARAVRVKSARGEADLSDYPLLEHIDDIITKGKSVDIPWEKFTYEEIV